MDNPSPISPFNEDTISLTDNYGSLVNTLYNINTKIFDNSETVLVDTRTEEPSFISLRTAIQKLREQKHFTKDTYFGVVLDVDASIPPGSDEYQYTIYVDVPGFQIEEIDDIDYFADPDGLFIRNIEHLKFTPENISSMMPFPVKGDIVKVRVPENYFSSPTSNPTERVFLGVYKKTKILPSNNPQVITTQKNREVLSKRVKQESLYYFKPKDVSISIPVFFNGFEVSSLPAFRNKPGTKEGQGFVQKNHYALDIAMPKGTPLALQIPMILVSANNTEKDRNGTAGIHLVTTDINTNFKFRFMHLDEISSEILKLSEGAIIPAGTLLGKTGNSGRYLNGNQVDTHLHFDTRQILDKNNISKVRLVSPLFLLNGTITVRDYIRDATGVKKSFSVPLNLTEELTTSTIIPAENIAEIPSSVKIEPNPVDKAISRSAPTKLPKLSLIQFEVDYAKGVPIDRNIGSRTIKIREDLKNDLLNIKQILNDYNIPFTCIGQDIDLLNKNISLLAKVGLEIRLNPWSGLSLYSNLEADDYFIGPDYSHPLGNGYKLIVYGNVKRNLRYFNKKYVPEKKIIEVYDAKRLNTNSAPSIKKIFKSVINVTKIFEDHGFISVLPKQEFFLYSDLSKSNWNIFQKSSKIIKGYSYKELLSTVYENNNESIWSLPDVKWDGNKFI